jgi:hypothetical protein
MNFLLVYDDDLAEIFLLIYYDDLYWHNFLLLYLSVNTDIEILSVYTEGIAMKK